MRNRLIAVVLLTLSAPAAVAAAAEPSPFVGEWHWNKAASTGAPGEPQPREMVLAITSADTARVAWTLTTTEGNGERHVQSFDGPGDGKPVPIPRSTDGSTGAFTVTATTLDSVYADRDGDTDRASCALSADRRQMTCRGSESDGKGRSAAYVDVYDRK
jgi:opacity protein-like surface antigen